MLSLRVQVSPEQREWALEIIQRDKTVERDNRRHTASSPALPPRHGGDSGALPNRLRHSGSV